MSSLLYIIPLLFLSGTTDCTLENVVSDYDSKIVINETKKDTLPNPPKPGPALAPGHVKVQGTRLASKNCEGKEINNYILIRIDKIFEYGSSTPPIALNDSLAIRTQSKICFNVGDQKTLLLQHLQSPTTNDSIKTDWVLKKLETD